MTAYVKGDDGHTTRYQHHCWYVTWVLPESPSVDAAAAVASVVPIAMTTEKVGVTKMKHSQVIHTI